MMAGSGARGSDAQIGQLAGMRGLMAKPDGSILEIPITANFREGLDVLQYFISTHGARKGLVDTALQTANSGYLTRRLADVAQDLTITEADCGASQGLPVSAIGEPGEWGESLRDRALGRVVAEDVRHSDSGAVVIPAGTLLDGPYLDRLEALGVEQVVVRSPVTCETRYGICAACYGQDLATGRRVEIGAAVGVIAAQSLGEPSTQLTMRTFHTGGVASPVEDITQGLPQVESLFEAREPEKSAILAEIAGMVSFGQDTKSKQRLIIIDRVLRTHSVLIPKGRQIQVSDGQDVERGDVLVDGQPNPHDLLRVLGVPALTTYLIQGIQKVYRQQGIRIHDKHIEVIVHQMLRQVEIVEPGDTLFGTGEKVSRARLGEENERAQAEGGAPATWRPIVLGIKAAAQSADSFLAAASFERTSEVLAKAALQGESDRLRGLKENLILGRRIPAGTGRDWETEAASAGSEVSP